MNHLPETSPVSGQRHADIWGHIQATNPTFETRPRGETGAGGRSSSSCSGSNLTGASQFRSADAAASNADGFTGNRQALPKKPSTCRDVVIGVACQSLNHSSTTSAGNRLASAGHDRSCAPGLAGGGTRGSLPTRSRPRASPMKFWRGSSQPDTAASTARVSPSPWPAAPSRARLTAYAGQQPGTPIRWRPQSVHRARTIPQVR
jgi:hypothetical protein